MKYRGCCIFLISWTWWTVVSCDWLHVDNSIQNVLTSHCDSPRRHTVTATDDLHTTVARHDALRPGTSDHGTPIYDSQNASSPSAVERSAECDIWTVIPEDDQSELVLLVNSVEFQPRDLLFISSDSSGKTFGYNFNLSQLDPDLFPKDMRSSDRLVLVWVRYPVVSEPAVSGQQKLAFSYWIRRSKASVEEKEKVVLMGAIVISIFTVIATVISVTRASKCQCVRRAVLYLKSRKRGVFSSRSGVSDRTGSVDARDVTSGEAVSLMIVNPSRFNLGVASYLEDPGMSHAPAHSSSLNQQIREVGITRQRPADFETGNVSVACSSLTVIEASREECAETLRPDNLDVPETSSPTMSALIGLLPPASGDSTVPPPTCHRQSSLSLLASLIPSRLRGRPSVFASHPPQRVGVSPSSNGDGFGRRTVEVFANSGTISVLSQHALGTEHSYSRTRTGGDAPVQDLLPSYNELPPPRYSILFPNDT